MTYDNTNSGALFPMNESWNIIQQGKLNIDGHDHSVIAVKRKNRNGEEILDLFQSIGTLKPNEQKSKDNDPDAKGVIENVQDQGAKRIAAWKKTSEGGNAFLSLAISDFTGGSKTDETETVEPEPDDDKTIPF